MSDLALNFGDIYKQVSDFLGIGTSPAGADLTKVKNITYRGYMRFLMPMNIRNGRNYTWSFLKQIGTLTTQAGVWEYELPSDFNYFWWGPTWGKQANSMNPTPTSMEYIRKMLSANSSNSYPKYWSLNTEKYTVESGSQYSLVLYPPPDSDDDMLYGYIMTPDKPTEETHYFIGGALASECILECALAEAEVQENDRADLHVRKAMDLLQSLIEMDCKRAMTTVGSSNTGSNLWVNDPVLARELRFPYDITSAYGVTA